MVVFLVFVHFFKLMNLNRISKIDGHGVRKMETGKNIKEELIIDYTKKVRSLNF